MGQNYFNTLPLRLQLEELGKCRFMDRSEFANGCDYLKGKKIVIVGCGAQGLNQGLNLRDSGLDVAYALRESAIMLVRGFDLGTYLAQVYGNAGDLLKGRQMPSHMSGRAARGVLPWKSMQVWTPRSGR